MLPTFHLCRELKCTHCGFIILRLSFSYPHSYNRLFFSLLITNVCFFFFLPERSVNGVLQHEVATRRRYTNNSTYQIAVQSGLLGTSIPSLNVNYNLNYFKCKLQWGVGTSQRFRIAWIKPEGKRSSFTQPSFPSDLFMQVTFMLDRKYNDRPDGNSTCVSYECSVTLRQRATCRCACDGDR